jgi:predicted homoserine dehydrogenase-like protein
MTWFRHEAGVTWWCGFGDDPQVQTQVINLLREIGVAAPGKGPELQNPELKIQNPDQDKR